MKSDAYKASAIRSLISKPGWLRVSWTKKVGDLPLKQEMRFTSARKMREWINGEGAALANDGTGEAVFHVYAMIGADTFSMLCQMERAQDEEDAYEAKRLKRDRLDIN